MAIYRVAITATVLGEPVANVIYVDGGSNNASQVCDAVQTHWVGTLKGHQIASCHYSAITATEIEHSLTDPDYFQKSISDVGTVGAGDHSDPQLALCLRLHTGLSGRRRRGRVFLFGIPDDYVVDGKISGNTYSNDAASLVTKFCGDTPTSGLKLQVFSRAYFSLLSNPFESSHKPVTNITAATVMSTMRSRKPAA